jgi:thiol-disulfide isomerase/thioredoxin
MAASEVSLARWRRLAAVGTVLVAGLAVWLALLAFEEFVTADLRWGLWLGCALLFTVSLGAGRRGGGAWAPLLVAAPVLLDLGVPLARDLTPFWPFPALWLGSALAGWMVGRSPRRATLVASAVLAVLALAYGGRVVPRILGAELNVYTDEPAPALVLESLDGTPYPSAELAGRIVVLDFFATWCLPCRAELPEVEAVRQALAERDDIVILIVGDGDSGDTREQVSHFAAESDLDLPFVWDPRGVTHDAFGFDNIPALAVIDRQGRVRLKRVGFNAAETGFRDTLLSVLESL